MIEDRHRFKTYFEGLWHDAINYFDEWVVKQEWPLPQGGFTERMSGVRHVFQCTGLKDKNGRLIWEGDIVRVKDDPAGPWSDNDKMETETVEWTSRGWSPFCDACGQIDATYMYTDRSGGIEIIGNTTQNPELLERKAADDGI